jgi:hypothetical protein
LLLVRGVCRLRASPDGSVLVWLSAVSSRFQRRTFQSISAQLKADG